MYNPLHPPMSSDGKGRTYHAEGKPYKSAEDAAEHLGISRSRYYTLVNSEKHYHSTYFIKEKSTYK